jgi:putative hydrolase of the HAD superfamily
VVEPSVENLIFDLGGVILDLSVDHTIEAFARLSGLPKQKVQDIFVSAPGFNEYEKGGMGDDDFRNFLKKTYSLNASFADIDVCWNAMLRGIPAVKLDLLNKLKELYNVYLLSNTNEIHIKYINANMIPEINNERLLDRYFHKAYYSHRMLKRKPDAEIFEQVLEENNMVPSKTLFLDDNAFNIEGARSVGIKTVLVTTPDLILDYFHA